MVIYQTRCYLWRARFQCPFFTFPSPDFRGRGRTLAALAALVAVDIGPFHRLLLGHVAIVLGVVVDPHLTEGIFSSADYDDGRLYGTN